MSFRSKPRGGLAKILCVPAFLLLVVHPSWATGYYVSCSGNDNNNGTSTSTPWATLSKASSGNYAPGDQVLLQDGCVWSTGTFQPTRSGTSGSPIVLSNYGSGALPRIIGSNAPAIYLLNVSYWTIQNVDLSQIGQTPQGLDSGNQHGKDNDQHADTYMWAVLEVRALEVNHSSCTTTCTVNNVTLQNLIVHDGQWIGIFAEAGYYNSGDNGTGYINNLTINQAEVRGNQAAGIQVEGTFLGQTNFRVGSVNVLNSSVYDNAGDGIVVSQVKGGLSQGNHTYHNGIVRNARVGNWVWNAQDYTVQFNESDHNMTPLSDFEDTHARDGGGYDLDLGSINSTVQYNWSHDNYGEGVLVLTWPVGYGYSCCTTTNATVRYNVFERDGEKQAGGITVFGGVTGWIYNNTVYNVAARPDTTGMFNGTGGAFTSSIYAKSGSPNVQIYNNNFISDGTVNPGADDTIVWGDGKGTFVFNNNAWHRVEGGDDWYWNGDTTSFSGWQAKGFDSVGMDVDPQIGGAFGGGPVAYQLNSTSPLINRGANLSGRAPGGVGTRDYFGNPIPNGGAFDIGAAEYTGTYSTQQSNATPVAHTSFGPSVRIAAITNNGQNIAKGATASWSVTITDSSGNPVSGVTVECFMLNQSWQAIDAHLISTTNTSGVASFSTNATSSSGTYFLLLPEVRPPSGTYYDSSQNAAWDTYFNVS